MNAILNLLRGLISAPASPPATGALSGFPVSQGFDAHASMAAFAAFPWVRACIDAISTDLTGLPLRIVRGSGDQAEVVDDILLRNLLENPTSWQGREAWEGEILRQLLLSGNGYALPVGGSTPSTVPLMHCESVSIIPGPFGGPAGYTYRSVGGGETTYAPEAVIHWRLAAWENGPQGLIGEGLIRALQPDLNADLNSARLSARAARQGRPSAVFKPKDASGVDAQIAQKVNQAYAKILEGGSASMVLPGSFDVDFPAFTPRDLEFAEQRKLTRETVLAAFGVPPTRVGLPTANYATSQQQNTVYWQGLIGLARLIDAGLTKIARKFSPDYSIRHDFSAVEALQEARTARLDRVQKWVDLGASPAQAAAYEGFDDAPVATEAATAQQSARRSAFPAATSALEWLSTARSVNSPEKQLRVNRRLQQTELALDPENPSLEDSDYAQPPRAYCEQLKADYPSIWRAGGNERGPEAFILWGKYLEGDRSEVVLNWVKEREAWAARHYEDGDAFVGSDPENPTLSNIGGVVAWLKWGVVGQLGWARMRDLLERLKDSIDADTSLGASEYLQPPFDYCVRLREEYPDIWSSATDEKFSLWEQFEKGVRSKKVLAWVKEREEWAKEGSIGCLPEDEENPSLPTMTRLITCLKWGVVCSEGWKRMEACIEKCKLSVDKISPEADLAEAWGVWRNSIHAPLEKEIGIAMRKVLARQLQGVLAAIPDMNEVDPDVDKLAAIFPAATRKILSVSMSKVYDPACARIWASSLASIGVETPRSDEVEFVEPSTSTREAMLKELAARVNTTTADAIHLMLITARKEGWSHEDLSAKLTASKIFSPSRSVPLAKQEATRLCASVALAAWKSTGKQIKKVWVSADEAGENPHHASLHGASASLDGNFRIQSGQFEGHEGSHPGSFGEIQLCMNCRCMIAPSIAEGEEA
jgi:HK97 family phage portal protein